MFFILKVAAVLVLTVLLLLTAVVYFSGPRLPEDVDKTIDRVLRSELPEFIKGETGYVQPRNTSVWYESIGKNTATKGTVLLFMGIANDAFGWPQGFIDSLVESGYRVIRFDYRGTGMSDWMPNWKKTPYSLTDLASDAELILDALNIDKAHLVGVSMGAMVAQEFAIHFPERALTLACMMSSGDIMDPQLKGLSKGLTFELIKTGLKYGLLPTEKNTIKMYIAARILLRGDADYRIDVKGTAEQVLYNVRNRHGYNPHVSAQHQQAVRRSGPRYEQLKKLQIPALVIHGQNDPFVPIEHSKKLASVLPKARTRWLANMGHDIPPGLYGSLIDELIKNFERNPGS